MREDGRWKRKKLEKEKREEEEQLTQSHQATPLLSLFHSIIETTIDLLFTIYNILIYGYKRTAYLDKLVSSNLGQT